jgi:hypothetical protein
VQRAFLVVYGNDDAEATRGDGGILHF